MKEISWENYYEKFYDWSESTQKNRAMDLRTTAPLTRFLLAYQRNLALTSLRTKMQSQRSPTSIMRITRRKDQSKQGFFTKPMAAIGVAGEIDIRTSHKHNGRCNGDCAHCLPHYGYRYGRWYYGHGHQYGCGFGGNKGGGGL